MSRERGLVGFESEGKEKRYKIEKELADFDQALERVIKFVFRFRREIEENKRNGKMESELILKYFGRDMTKQEREIFKSVEKNISIRDVIDIDYRREKYMPMPLRIKLLQRYFEKKLAKRRGGKQIEIDTSDFEKEEVNKPIIQLERLILSNEVFSFLNRQLGVFLNKTFLRKIISGDKELSAVYYFSSEKLREFVDEYDLKLRLPNARELVAFILFIIGENDIVNELVFKQYIRQADLFIRNNYSEPDNEQEKEFMIDFFEIWQEALDSGELTEFINFIKNNLKS